MLDRRLDSQRGRFVLDVEFLERGARDGCQPGFDVLAFIGSQLRLDGPIFVGPEGLDLGFPVTDEPQRDRLNAA